MNKHWLAVGLAWALGLSVTRGEFTSWNIATEIPDNDPTGLQDTQILSGFGGALQSLEVWLKILPVSPNYVWNGDLYVTLQHESGCSVLLNRSGVTANDSLGYSDNGLDIHFVLGGLDVHRYWDSAPGFNGDGQLTGNWGVDGRDVDPDVVLDTSPRTDMFADFIGVDPNGSWTLFAADMNQNGHAMLDAWGLDITPIPEPGTMALLGFGGLFLFCRRSRGRG